MIVCSENAGLRAVFEMSTVLPVFALWTSLLLVTRTSALLAGKDACNALAAARFGLEGINILDISAVLREDFTVPSSPPFLPMPVTDLSTCECVLTYNHDDSPTPVNINLYLPLTNWNGRFLGVGGSRYLAGIPITMAPFAQQGYATASTDAGLPLGGDPITVATWALLPGGSVNDELLQNFGSRSVHDLAVIGKAVVEHFYGEPPRYAYWNGCSQGGRQGLMAAQKHPEDFDGIVAGAPANYWTQYIIAEHWPQTVMEELQTWPPSCVLDFIRKAVETCDGLDDAEDGIISDVEQCRVLFDPSALIGVEVACNDQRIAIDAQTAEVVRKIWDGPSWWYGLNPGAPLAFLANTTIAEGAPRGLPWSIEDDWIKYFVKRDPKYKTTNIGFTELRQLLDTSVNIYDNVMGASNPDLRKFRDNGGKLLVWHGEADQLIFPQGSTRYYRTVYGFLSKTHQAGGSKTPAIEDFYRLFLAPGMDHCAALGLTPGAAPLDPLSALVVWVESNKAPDTLPAALHGETQAVRKLCPYPRRAVYCGEGDENDVDNWECR